MEYYDRYQSFRENGQVKLIPNIKIDIESSDLYVTFDKKTMRLDNLSYKYYGDSNFGWLILLANPQHGSMEFELKDNIELRIPYPLNTAISRYELKVNDIKTH